MRSLRIKPFEELLPCDICGKSACWVYDWNINKILCDKHYKIELRKVKLIKLANNETSSHI